MCGFCNMCVCLCGFLLCVYICVGFVILGRVVCGKDNIN